MIPKIGLAIVTGPKCPGCVKLKNMLNTLNVEFAEVSIFSVPKIARSGLPQIYYNGELIFRGSPKALKDVKGILRVNDIEYGGE